ncbi:hypothetical protein E4T56_gene11091 [Termitomyces sp. T112]|nr:hypothetical protein E4T56_gene11091 [Termitomyces sp. T112]
MFHQYNGLAFIPPPPVVQSSDYSFTQASLPSETHNELAIQGGLYLTRFVFTDSIRFSRTVLFSYPPTSPLLLPLTRIQ